MKNVVIAGTGILGEATAYKFLKNGNNVIINSRNEEHLKKIKNLLSPYGKIDYIAKNLKDRDSCLLFYNEIKRQAIRIDTLVITIGGYIEDTIDDLSGLDEMVNNHLKIPLLLINALLPSMNSPSNIILVSNSDTFEKNRKNLLSYTVSKYALNKSVKLMAAELITRNIRVNGVAPEYIDQTFEPDRDYTIMRKLGDLPTPPEDISEVIFFLADENSWINGAVIPVDGGHSLI